MRTILYLLYVVAATIPVVVSVRLGLRIDGTVIVYSAILMGLIGLLHRVMERDT